MSDALWYKDAIIYQLHVRSFFDSIGDGIGDFGGLTQKLDYLQDLGVTALWLMPFYPSPLRDDGYDIADYENIHPEYGTLDSFREFLDAAHQRDLRVITELVINHTSDQHPWFQRARRAPPGSPQRDFYVWSDTPEKYRAARIIFSDFEASNWSYDQVAKAYFWHRFYSHQPDLNYDNPEVWKAIFPLLDFWLEMGVDGLRLDAVPYLYEREGTNCENLPETHAFLKALRRHVDERFPNRMLLAEANQWPEDAAAYFGEGDECHMAFHFPVMPRMFMAIHREDRFPLVDIMDQTPAIHETCQWVMFLRNHDELTLEMVTDDERDYMYRAYATDSRARINLGIRRRLAPLLSNNRRRIELMNGLLFSLPGTPVLYYGDEIGMGDNIYLGDRNGVRTPMQWSADRNAGFSRANPQKLFLPIIIDPEYHFEALNVEAQQNNPHSLLWWIKRLIDMRKHSLALSRGTLEFLQPENRKVLAFLRKFGSETVLIVVNLSRFVQGVELDLSAYTNCILLEMFGGTRLPAIGKAPYFLTLGPHSFMWFHLAEAETSAPDTAESPRFDRLPLLTSRESWLAATFRDEDLWERTLAAFLSAKTLSAEQDRTVKAARVMDSARLPLASGEALLLLVQAELQSGEVERHPLPVMLAGEERQAEILQSSPVTAIARVKAQGEGILVDAALDPAYAGFLLETIDRERRLPTRSGAELLGWRFQPLVSPEETLSSLPLAPVKTSRSNVLFNFGNRLMLKVLRRVEEGTHPEVEFGRFFRHSQVPCSVAWLLGGIEIRSRRATPLTLALLQEYVPNEGDAWHYTLDALGDFFERVVTLDTSQSPPGVVLADQEAAPQQLDELLGGHLDSVRLLAHRTAEMHLALASDPHDPHFAPETMSALDQRSLYQSLRGAALTTFDELRRRLPALPGPIRERAAELSALQGVALEQYRKLLGERLGGVRIRCHGEYHLGQVLFTGKDFVIIDFEGNARTPLSQRRIKRSPLRDVASMVRSFELVARLALADVTSFGPAPGAIRPADLPRVAPWTRCWINRVSAVFWQTYVEQPGIQALLPPASEGREMLLRSIRLELLLSELEQALRESSDRRLIVIESVLDHLSGVSA